jgi:hypothetical protein
MCAALALVHPVGPLALSPGGRHLYVSSQIDGVLAFRRASNTGALTPLPGTQACVTEDGHGGGCGDGRGLSDSDDIVVSPDGRHVYLVATAVAVFSRHERSGALTQLAGLDGCVASPVEGLGGECAEMEQLVDPEDLALSLLAPVRGRIA